MCVPVCSDSVILLAAAPWSAWPNRGVIWGASYMNQTGRSGPIVGETSWTVSPPSSVTMDCSASLVELTGTARIMSYGAEHASARRMPRTPRFHRVTARRFDAYVSTGRGERNGMCAPSERCPRFDEHMFDDRVARIWLDDLNAEQRQAATHTGDTLLI